ncbi:MAG: exo-alpha-sialidase [Clostridia bacterium]|nr:exo-alpha-sialidase [Clostridia bacterium]
MNPFIDKVLERMSNDDKRQLSEIYEPTIVSETDADAWKHLTVMRDGRLRYYGIYKKESIFDKGNTLCYRESCDGGLTWKMHVIEDKNVLGESTYIPFMDKYMKTYYIDGKGVFVRIGDDPDDVLPKEIQVTALDCIEPLAPFYLRDRERIIIVTTERRPDRHPTCFYPVLFISDNRGESWRELHMEECPYFELQWPDQGGRWQQNNRENHIVELTDGTLYMISRTAMNYHYESYSYDGGDTWTEFKPSRFHGTGSMPCFERLADGRILFFWCNTKLLPELTTADGIWEDHFTNRDTNCCAISSDECKSFRGYREIYLNPIRNNPDFRGVGGPSEGDKSVHQFEALELPMNKVLVAVGQHEAVRRLLIFDVDWLYEHKREERFLYGLKNLSTHSYVKSIEGGFKVSREHPLAHSGHCAFNRTNLALLVPSPANTYTKGGTDILDDYNEALHLTRVEDDRLISGIAGAVWNFPSHRKGKVTVRAYIPGKGLRVSLLNYWMNPSDNTVEYFSDYSIVLRGDMQYGEMFTDFVFNFDCDRGTVILTAGDKLKLERKLNGEHPDGLCYLHLQSAATEADSIGASIEKFSFEGIE